MQIEHIEGNPAGKKGPVLSRSALLSKLEANASAWRCSRGLEQDLGICLPSVHILLLPKDPTPGAQCQP